MKINLSFLKSCSVLFALSLLVVLTGCKDDTTEILGQGGYVQFKLYKQSAKAETRAAELDYLSSAKKIEVVLQNSSGSRVRQTLNLNAYNDTNAEFGLRSDKLELLSGDYTIIGYYLYDELNQELGAGVMEEQETFTVIAGGLITKDLYVAVKKRGQVQFTLVKDFSNFQQTRSSENNSYQFSSIRKADIEVQNLFSDERITLKDIKFRVSSKVIDNNGTAWVTAAATTDSIVSLEAGGYQIIRYSIYNNSNQLLEYANPITETRFVVTDNNKVDVDVPIALNETAENIKDYYALKEIWEALDGKNWYYMGDSYALGVNWNFDKDIDTWGNQPGVSLNSQGRVTSLNLGCFGPKGDVPAALGQLTELVFLDCGNHNDRLGGNLFPGVDRNVKDRMNYYNLYSKRDIRASFSDAIVEGFKLKGVDLGSPRPIVADRPQTLDVMPGSLTNAITSLPKEIGKLTKLENIFIANGLIAELPEELALLENCTDIEIYNCPRMTSYPMVINKMPELALINISSNPQLSAEELYKGLNDFALNSPSNDKLQLLYCGFNNLEELPASFSNLVKIGLLDFTSNNIKKLHPLSRNVAPVQMLFNDNQIEEIPVDANGLFCNIDDIETIMMSGNKLKQFPNIFDARSVYQISDLDFSYNEIESIQGEEDGTYKGVNCESLSLHGNKLKKFPSVIFNVGSVISYINVAGNGIESFENGTLFGKNLHMLESLDLSYNKLTKLPNEFDATSLPYLYSIDLSYNRFADFPYGPLNVSRLTVMSIRYQRDEIGNRCLKTWPTGLYTCASLLAFYIGGNDLRKIDDRISPQIYMFDIQDNPNISIDLTDVCYYIQAGAYLLIYDSSQDIRGCSALDLDN